MTQTVLANLFWRLLATLDTSRPLTALWGTA